MLRKFFYLLPWFSLALLVLPAQADSGISFGPYVQHISSQAATVLLRTDADHILSLNYHKVGNVNWKTKTDEVAKTIHRFRLASLKAGQEYEYYLADGTTRLTQTYTFSTQKDVKVNNPLKVAVFGDYGALTIDEARIETQIQQWNPDIAITTGDNAYNSGALSEFQTNVFEPYQAFLANVALYPSMGNHDFTTDSGAPFKELFELPQANSGTEDYYSFNYDQIHFVAMNSNLDYSVGSEQYNWLVSDLSGSDSRWKIVYYHHPVFSSGAHGSTTDMYSILGPVFELYDVDLVLNGHDHDYERNTLVNGVLYVVTGGGGNVLYNQTTVNPYSAFFLSTYNFVGLTINKDQLKLKAIDENGYVFDQKTLSK